MISEYFGKQIKFEIAGLQEGSLKEQLLHFQTQLEVKGLKIKKEKAPKTWMQAFALLMSYIDKQKSQHKKVIFIDELPWFDTPRSKFLMAFQNFWNSYCTKITDLIVVICGSAASWMIKKIVKNKGSLHNRISEKINLQPFTLAETALFLKAKGIAWSQYDITQCYMVTGGVPFYLEAIKKGESVAQCIDRLCFTKNGLLFEEFDELYTSLFENSQMHYTLIKLLNKHKQGLTRNEIVANLKIASGSAISTILDELTQSGFVTKLLPTQTNSYNNIYKLTDFFTIFYLKFMQGTKSIGKGTWLTKSASSSWSAWSGLTYETICLQHLTQIKNVLQLNAIHTEVSSWRGSFEDTGTQIDIVINRADRVINICEVKFSNAIFNINKNVANELRSKIHILKQQAISKNKTVMLTMITVYGVYNNEYANELVQNQIVLSDLFKQ